MHAQSHFSVYTVHKPLCSMYMYLHLQHVCPQVVCSQVVSVWVPFQRLQTVFNKLSLKMGKWRKMFNDPMYVSIVDHLKLNISTNGTPYMWPQCLCNRIYIPVFNETGFQCKIMQDSSLGPLSPWSFRRYHTYITSACYTAFGCCYCT